MLRTAPAGLLLLTLPLGCAPALRPSEDPAATLGVRLERPAPALAGIDAAKHHLQWSAFRTRSGRRVAVYLAFPESTASSAAVVVVPDSRGTLPARAVAERLAEDGYLALVPDYAFGATGLSEDGDRFTAGPILSAEVLEGAMRFARSLRACNGSVGLVGLGLGARAVCSLEAEPAAMVLVFHGRGADSAQTDDPDCAAARRVVLDPRSLDEALHGDPARLRSRAPAPEAWREVGRALQAGL